MRAAHVRCRLIGAGMQCERRLVSEPHREIGIQIQRAGASRSLAVHDDARTGHYGNVGACSLRWQRLHISSTPSL